MTHDQILASFIVAALFVGGALGASILYFIQCRIEDSKFAKHRKHKMEIDEDLEAVWQAVQYH